MNIVLLIARLLLAMVFLVAGLSKLVDPRGSRQAVIDFGMPAVLASTLGLLLPIVELAVAVSLVLRPSAWWGALGALALLLLFIVGISVNLARGRKPDCHCFGQLHSAPIGWWTLARNLILLCIAGLIIWQGRGDVGMSAVRWLWDLSFEGRVGLGVGLVLFALLAALGWFQWQLMHQYGRMLLRLDALEAQIATEYSAITPPSSTAPLGDPHAIAPPFPTAPATGLSVGSPAPLFALTDLDGKVHTLEDLRTLGKLIFLTFTDPGCRSCTDLLPYLSRWQRELANTMVLVLISRGTPESNRVKSTQYGLTHVFLQQDREVALAYQVPGTPSSVLVHPDGTIFSPVAAGTDAIHALVARLIGSPIPSPVNNPKWSCPPIATAQQRFVELKIGMPAPALALPDLLEKTVLLTEFLGKPTLVLFWNPGCGFCVRMLGDLKAWEMHPRRGVPQLLVISSGNLEENWALGLRSPIVLDQDFTTGRAFGATGTPSAVLIDAEGMIASAVVVGAPNILALAGTGSEQAKAASS